MYQACLNAGTGTMLTTPPQPGPGAPSVLSTSVLMYIGIPIAKLIAALRRSVTHFFDKRESGGGKRRVQRPLGPHGVT